MGSASKPMAKFRSSPSNRSTPARTAASPPIRTRGAEFIVLPPSVRRAREQPPGKQTNAGFEKWRGRGCGVGGEGQKGEGKLQEPRKKEEARRRERNRCAHDKEGFVNLCCAALVKGGPAKAAATPT